MGPPGAAGRAGLPADAGAIGARAATPGLVKFGADGVMGSMTPGGIGWRGPDSTWPGRAGGTGLATVGTGRPGAIAAAGGAGGGAIRGGTVAGGGAPGGELPANGGRMGSDGRPAGRSGAGVGAIRGGTV